MFWYFSGFCGGKVGVKETAGVSILKPVAMSLKRLLRGCAPDGPFVSAHVDDLIVFSLWLKVERMRVANRAEDDISLVVW